MSGAVEGRAMAARQRPGRTIRGYSAVLLPMHRSGGPDWPGFEAHLGRTLDARLVPAVNMDTGFGPVLGERDRATALGIAARLCAGRPGPDRFLAGALVDDAPGAPFDPDRYRRAMEAIATAGGTPIVFPSFGLAGVAEGDLVAVHEQLASAVDRCFGFELGTMFHPAGRIWDAATFEGILGIPQVAGAKHSSLRRGPELERLARRDRLRPGFLVLTGNDLAIDMVAYGSDYLLGLSTFAPDAFAARDRAWAAGDEVAFWELNDVLQYLGQFAFRPPVPAYRHDAAMFLALRRWIDHDGTHPDSPRRPESDRQVLADLVDRLDRHLGEPG